MKEGVAQKTSRKWLGAEPKLSNRAAPETEDDTVTAWHWQQSQVGRGLFASHPKLLMAARDQR